MMRCGCGQVMPNENHSDCPYYEAFVVRLKREVETEKQAVSFASSFEAWLDEPAVKELRGYATTDNIATAPHVLALLRDAFMSARDKPSTVWKSNR